MATSLGARRPTRNRGRKPYRNPARRHQNRWVGSRNLNALGLYPITGGSSVAGVLLGTPTAEITAELFRYPDLTTTVATLSLSHSRTWQDVLSEAGAGQITLQNDDPALSDFEDDGDDIVVFKYRGERALAMLCERKTERVVAQGEEHDQTTTYSGRGHLALLERVMVYPASGVGRKPIEEDRLFNWTSPNFDDTGWVTAKTLGTVQDAVDIVAFIYSVAPSEIDTNLPHNVLRVFAAPGSTSTFLVAPAGSCYFRESFTVASTDTYYLTFFCDDQGEFYFDGQRVAEIKGVNWLGVATAQVDLSAGTHLAAARVENLSATGSLKYGWAIWELDDNGQPGALVWSGAPATKIAAYPSEPPGMTAGTAMRIVVEEAQDRGYLTDLTLNFTDTYDSDGVPWTVSADIATKTGTDVLTFLRELAATYVDLWMDPSDIKLWAWNVDGRGATLTGEIKAPTSATDPSSGNLRSYIRSGEFAPVGKFLLRHRDGWAQRTNAASIAAYGAREAKLEVGAPTSLVEVYRVADGQFAYFANPRTEIDADIHPAASVTDVPYLGFRVGDQITTPDGVKRVLAITMDEDNGTGLALPTLTLSSIVLGAEERTFQLLRKIG